LALIVFLIVYNQSVTMLILFLFGCLISSLYHPYLTRYLTRNWHRVR